MNIGISLITVVIYLLASCILVYYNIRKSSTFRYSLSCVLNVIYNIFAIPILIVTPWCIFIFVFLPYINITMTHAIQNMVGFYIPYSCLCYYYTKRSIDHYIIRYRYSTDHYLKPWDIKYLLEVKSVRRYLETISILLLLVYSLFIAWYLFHYPRFLMNDLLDHIREPTVVNNVLSITSKYYSNAILSYRYAVLRESFWVRCDNPIFRIHNYLNANNSDSDYLTYIVTVISISVLLLITFCILSPIVNAYRYLINKSSRNETDQFCNAFSPSPGFHASHVPIKSMLFERPINKVFELRKSLRNSILLILIATTVYSLLLRMLFGCIYDNSICFALAWIASMGYIFLYVLPHYLKFTWKRRKHDFLSGRLALHLFMIEILNENPIAIMVGFSLHTLTIITPFAYLLAKVYNVTLPTYNRYAHIAAIIGSFATIYTPLIIGYSNINALWANYRKRMLSNIFKSPLCNHSVLIGYGNLGKLFMTDYYKSISMFDKFISSIDKVYSLNALRIIYSHIFNNYYLLFGANGYLCAMDSRVFIIDNKRAVFNEIYNIDTDNIGSVLITTENDDSTDKCKYVSYIMITGVLGDAKLHTIMQSVKMDNAKQIINTANDSYLPLKLYYELKHSKDLSVISVVHDSDTQAIIEKANISNKWYLVYPNIKGANDIYDRLQVILQPSSIIPNILFIGKGKMFYYIFKRMLRSRYLQHVLNDSLHNIRIITDEEYILNEASPIQFSPSRYTFKYSLARRMRLTHSYNYMWNIILDRSSECKDISYLSIPVFKSSMSNFESISRLLCEKMPAVIIIFGDFGTEIFRILCEAIKSIIYANGIARTDSNNMVIPKVIVSCQDSVKDGIVNVMQRSLICTSNDYLDWKDNIIVHDKRVADDILTLAQMISK